MLSSMRFCIALAAIILSGPMQVKKCRRRRFSIDHIMFARTPLRNCSLYSAARFSYRSLGRLLTAAGL